MDIWEAILLEKDIYLEKINKVQDYIEKHLDESLSVDFLCQISGFSQFHFQRIFASITGEPIYSFIKRIRLEKAAYMLLAKKDRPVIDIALSVGFSNQASFAKAFKKRFGTSSSQYRNKRKEIDKSAFFSNYNKGIDLNIEPLNIEIRKEKEIKIVYIRYSGAYKGDSELFKNLFDSLYQWVDERNLIKKSSRWFVIYHDFGDETSEDILRVSVCMSIEGNVAISGNIGTMTIPEGKFGVGTFYVGAEDYGKAWYYMYAKWLPKSGYKVADRFAFEHYPSQDENAKKQLVEIYIPLED